MREVFLCFTLRHGHALQYASCELRDDKTVVLVAVETAGMALQHASTRLKSDFIVVQVAVGQCGLALQYASSTEDKKREEIVFQSSAL